MANPQVEEGYVKIANELQEAFCRTRIPGEERQVLDVIIRKTYGWNKCEDAISLSQFVLMTGINKPCVIRAIQGLLSKKIPTKDTIKDTVTNDNIIVANPEALRLAELLFSEIIKENPKSRLLN